MKKFSKKAQATLEYAIIIAVIVAALVAMNTYMKRGISGKMKESADSIGDQYSPGNTTSNKITTTFSDIHETTTPAGVTTNTYNQNTRDVTGSEDVGATSGEVWPQ